MEKKIEVSVSEAIKLFTLARAAMTTFSETIDNLKVQIDQTMQAKIHPHESHAAFNDDNCNGSAKSLKQKLDLSMVEGKDKKEV